MSPRRWVWVLVIAVAAIGVLAGAACAKVNVIWTWPATGEPVEDGGHITLVEELFLRGSVIPPCQAYAPATLLLNGKPTDKFSVDPHASWEECGSVRVSGGFTHLESSSEGVVARAEAPITITEPGPCDYALSGVRGSPGFLVSGVATLKQGGVGTNCAAQLPVRGSLGPFGPDAGGVGLLRSRLEHVGAPLEALERYWTEIAAHDFSGAYAHLAPGVTGLSESQFISGEQRARIERVEFFGQPALVFGRRGASRARASIAVLSLVTRDKRFGCRVWSGSYKMIDARGRWLIERATLTPRRCA